MIGRTNTSSGVAFDSSMAVVRVSAPAGSTVTLSRGSTIKTSAEISSGSDSFYYFIVAPSSSPWTATATLNGNTDSKTVLANAAGEYDVELVYATFLMRDGVVQSGYTLSGITGSNITAATMTAMTDYMQIILPTNSGVYFNETSFSSYSTLYIDSAILDPNNCVSWIYEGVDSNQYWRSDTAGDMTAYVKYTYAHPRMKAQIDISGMGSTLKWLKFFSRATMSAGFELDLYNIYVK